jgi:maltose/moltooligosaccharide transporter
MAHTLQATEKPRLSFWQIWNMSFGFMGIQFGFALQNANVSRIFETLGGTEIALYWLAAPITGLVVQPIIGYLSDRTWHPTLGRRRPFFLVGAILASIALFIMPNSSVLWVAVGMLWILDTSINISMEPFRALVGDLLPSSQRTAGFAAQTFFIGIGAVVASLLPYVFTNWFGVPNTAPEGQIPASVKWSFYIGGAVFFAAVFWTVIRTREYPPENLEEFEAEKRGTRFWEGVKETVLGIFRMPQTMLQLAVVQFFSWFALFSMWIYTTPALTSHVYGTTDPTSALYNEGANWVGVCFAVYSGVSAVFALLLPALAKATSRKLTHLICLVLGGLGLISIYFIQNPDLLLVSMVGVGIAWASILSMPYAILAGALPANRMGYFMGVFNFFIVIPQIVAGSVLDFVTNNIFGGEAIYALVLGGCAMIVGGFLTLIVNDVDEQVA